MTDIAKIAAEKERAAVVAWLRESANTLRSIAGMNLPAVSPVIARHNAGEYERLALKIENGDYLKGQAE